MRMVANSTAERDELLRQQHLRIAHTSGWEEIPRPRVPPAAPMSHTSMIKLGRIFDGFDRLRPGFTYFQRGALSLMPGDVETPVVVNHEMAHRVGFVRQLFEHPDTDGPWLAALVTITDPPAWLKAGTPASISYHGLQRQAIGESERILRGLIPEISILSPGVQPAERGARVATFHRVDATPSSSPARASDRLDAGEEIIHGARLIRRNIGTVLAVGGVPVRGF